MSQTVPKRQNWTFDVYVGYDLEAAWMPAPRPAILYRYSDIMGCSYSSCNHCEMYVTACSCGLRFMRHVALMEETRNNRNIRMENFNWADYLWQIGVCQRIILNGFWEIKLWKCELQTRLLATTPQCLMIIEGIETMSNHRHVTQDCHFSWHMFS
jgi:hypothetical protein